MTSPKAAKKLLRLVGRGDFDVDDAMGETDCKHGCYVEPDGTCPHGYESAALTAGVI